MNFIELCVAFTSAILTVAYPILIEVVSRLDDKYSSAQLTEAFYEETEFIAFRWSLYSSIFLIIAYFIFFKTWSLFPPNPLMENLNLIGCFITTASLIIIFIFLTKKVFVYYRPTKLITYFKECDQNILKVDSNNRKNIYFDSLVDVMIYCLRSKNIVVGKTLSSYFYEGFRNYRISAIGAVQYPFNYYQLIYDSIEELAILNHDQFAFWTNNTAGSNLLIGELAETKISTQTYSIIWHCQIKALKLKRPDFVKMHWQNSHQFFTYQLRLINPIFSKKNDNILNQEIIDQRTQERNDFFRFHTILGAYVFFKKEYELLDFFFTYTQSLPEDYPLLPTKMDEIFDLFYKLCNDFDTDFDWIASSYSFPEFSGMQADYKIKNEIQKYLCLLFLRQNTLKIHYVYQEPLRLPEIPKLQNVKRTQISNLQIFKSHLLIILSDLELLKAIHFDYLSPEYFENNGQTHPIAIIENHIIDLTDSIELVEVKQKISEEKKKIFYEISTNILVPVFQKYSCLIRQQRPTLNFSNFINGTIDIFDKKGFSDVEGVEVHGINNVFAAKAAKRFERGILESFILKQTESYTIKVDNISAAFARICTDKHKIVFFVFTNEEITIEPDYDFKLFPCSSSLGPVIFALEKEDVPNLVFKDPRPNYVNHELDLLSEDFQLYISILDLNEKTELHDEVKSAGFVNDIHKNALITIAYLAELQWKKEFKCVALNLASIYKSQGIINPVTDIKVF